jgi:hypothetical protein
MPSDHDIFEELRTFVLGKAKISDPDLLTGRSALFEDGYLRSIHLPELLLLIERVTQTPIDVENLRQGDLRDLDTIMERLVSGPANAWEAQ